MFVFEYRYTFWFALFVYAYRCDSCSGVGEVVAVVSCLDGDTMGYHFVGDSSVDVREHMP